MIDGECAKRSLAEGEGRSQMEFGNEETFSLRSNGNGPLSWRTATSLILRQAQDDGLFALAK